jgi:hypothetical protein
MLDGTLLVAILLSRGFTVSQVVAASSIATLATAGGVAVTLMALRSPERHRQGRLVVVGVAAAVLPVAAAGLLTSGSVLAVVVFLVILRTATTVSSSHRSLLVTEWVGVAKATQHSAVVGLALGSAGYLARTLLVVRVLRGTDVGAVLTGLTAVSALLAVAMCVTLRRSGDDTPSPVGNHLGTLLARPPSRALRRSVVLPATWALCPAVFSFAYLQGAALPVLVARYAHEPYELALLSVVGAAGVLTWVWLLVRPRVRLEVLPWLGLAGVALAVTSYYANVDLAMVAFAASVGLAGAAGLVLAGVRILARTTTDSESTAALAWISVTATASAVAGLLAANVAGRFEPTLLLPVGLAPYAGVLLFLALRRPPVATGSLRGIALIRLWVRQVRFILRAPTRPAAHGRDVGDFARRLARQVSRKVVTP